MFLWVAGGPSVIPKIGYKLNTDDRFRMLPRFPWKVSGQLYRLSEVDENVSLSRLISFCSNLDLMRDSGQLTKVR